MDIFHCPHVSLYTKIILSDGRQDNDHLYSSSLLVGFQYVLLLPEVELVAVKLSDIVHLSLWKCCVKKYSAEVTVMFLLQL